MPSRADVADTRASRPACDAVWWDGMCAAQVLCYLVWFALYGLVMVCARPDLDVQQTTYTYATKKGWLKTVRALPCGWLAYAAINTLITSAMTAPTQLFLRCVLVPATLSARADAAAAVARGSWRGK